MPCGLDTGRRRVSRVDQARCRLPSRASRAAPYLCACSLSRTARPLHETRRRSQVEQSRALSHRKGIGRDKVMRGGGEILPHWVRGGGRGSCIASLDIYAGCETEGSSAAPDPRYIDRLSVSCVQRRGGLYMHVLCLLGETSPALWVQTGHAE